VAVLTYAVLALAAVAVPAAPAAGRLAVLAGPAPAPVAAAGGPRVPTPVVAGVGALAGLLALGPAGGLVGGLLAVRWWRRGRRTRAARTAAAVAAELADALGRIVEELRAGAHPASALAGAATDGPLARAVLAPVAAAVALGDGVAAALAAGAERHPAVADDLRRLAAIWALADRHGVPAAELVAAALADLRWRRAHTDRVRALLAGPRATGAVLTALPALGIGLGELVGAGPLAVLRSGVLGQVLVVVGFGLAAAGAAWTGRITGSAVAR
jgi:tight adherence protein B